MVDPFQIFPDAAALLDRAFVIDDFLTSFAVVNCAEMRGKLQRLPARQRQHIEADRQLPG